MPMYIALSASATNIGSALAASGFRAEANSSWTTQQDRFARKRSDSLPYVVIDNGGDYNLRISFGSSSAPEPNTIFLISLGCDICFICRKVRYKK